MNRSRFFFLVMVLCLNTVFGFSQSYLKAYPSEGNEEFSGLQRLPAGDLLVAGSFSGTLQLGNTAYPALGQSDVFLARLDSLGEVVWVRTAGSRLIDETVSISNDLAGDVYWTGYFWNELRVGDSTLVACNSSKAIFLLKFSSGGDLLWSRCVSGTGLKLLGDAACSPDGNLVMTGSYSGSLFAGDTTLVATSMGDLFLLSFSGAGELEWVTTAGNTGTTRGRRIGFLQDRSIVVGGQFQGSFQLANQNFQTNTPDFDLFLARFSPMGSPVWALEAGGVFEASCTGLAVTEDDRIILSGSHEGVVDAGNGVRIQPPNFDDNAFLLQFDNSGTPLWGRTYGGTAAETSDGIRISGDRLWMSGTYSGSFEVGDLQVDAPPGLANHFMAAFDLYGNPLSLHTLTGNEFVLGRSLAALPKEGVLFGGVFAPDVRNGETQYVSGGGFDLYLIWPEGRTTSLSATRFPTPFIGLFPNPVVSQAILDLNGRSALVRLFDLSGRQVQQVLTTGPLSADALSPGLYHLVIYDRSGQQLLGWSRLLRR